MNQTTNHGIGRTAGAIATIVLLLLVASCRSRGTSQDTYVGGEGGEAEKIGLRASFKVLPTLYNTSGGVWFGTGGASLGITGNAIWQWEAAIGLTVKLGG